MRRAWLFECFFIGAIIVFCILGAICFQLAVRLRSDVIELELEIKRLEKRARDTEGMEVKYE